MKSLSPSDRAFIPQISAETHRLILGGWEPNDEEEARANAEIAAAREALRERAMARLPVQEPVGTREYRMDFTPSRFRAEEIL